MKMSICHIWEYNTSGKGKVMRGSPFFLKQKIKKIYKSSKQNISDVHNTVVCLEMKESRNIIPNRYSNSKSKIN